MTRILIVPIGHVDHAILTEIAQTLGETFGSQAALGGETPIPQNSYNSRRNQHHSTTILTWMEAVRPKGFERMLGVTDVDLYAQGLNFVFGEANMISGAAIISLTRLRQEFYGLPPDEQLLRARAVKEAIHEIGHTYGRGHCANVRCIMHFSNGLGDTDIKGPAFCIECRSQLGM